MKKNKCIFLIILLVVNVAIMSCKKNEEANPNNNTTTNTNNCLLSKVSVSDGEFCDFVYSNTGKLLSTHTGYPGSSGGYDYFYYDAQNRISYSLTEINDTTYYFYNSENLLTMLISCHLPNNDTATFEYNQNKQMTKSSRTQSQYMPKRYSVYSWGTDGNVQTEKYYENDQLVNTYTFEYDNMANRLTTERGPLRDPLSKNNTKIIYEDGVVYETNTYTYDANKLPIECIHVSKNGSSLVISNTYNCP